MTATAGRSGYAAPTAESVQALTPNHEGYVRLGRLAPAGRSFGIVPLRAATRGSANVARADTKAGRSWSAKIDPVDRRENRVFAATFSDVELTVLPDQVFEIVRTERDEVEG
jgi:hypothetical protein